MKKFFALLAAAVLAVVAAQNVEAQETRGDQPPAASVATSVPNEVVLKGKGTWKFQADSGGLDLVITRKDGALAGTLAATNVRSLDSNPVSISDIVVSERQISFNAVDANGGRLMVDGLRFNKARTRATGWVNHQGNLVWFDLSVDTKQ